ncbi:hypothetical protein TNCV_4713171 [Trichonephila clavipes]|nr:hypothetical protein TNCV_4713171 [Trichonephila clavipes]
MIPTYGEKCLSHKAVYNWVKKFSQSRSKIVDDDRSGRPVLFATKSTKQQVKELIRNDRRVTIDYIAMATAYSLTPDRLNFR